MEILKESFIKKNIKLIIKILAIYSFSGGLYLLLETFWDFHTSLEMYYLAGFLGIAALLFNNIFTYETDLLLQCTILTIVATISEGIVGHIYNINYQIWDYRNISLSLWDDQINLFFCTIWFVLFLIIIPVLDYIEWRLFNYMINIPPYYKVFGKKVFQFKG